MIKEKFLFARNAIIIIFILLNLGLLFFPREFIPYVVLANMLILVTGATLKIFKLKSQETKQEKRTVNEEDEVKMARMIFEKLNLPLFILDPRGNVTKKTSQIDLIFNKVIQHIDDFRTFSGAFAQVNQSLALEKDSDFQWEIRDHIYQVTMQSFHINQLFSGFIVVFSDITESHKLDVLHSEFLGDLSHELKTPLSAISGASEILNSSERVLSKKDRASFIEIITKESNRMNRLINELTNLTKLDDKIFSTLIKEKFQLTTLLDEVILLHKQELDLKGLEVILDPTCHTIIFADRDKTIQIFSNLMSNAIRYTEKGGITIRCEIKPKQTTIIFSDSGVGIEPANLGKIFKRFYRTDFARNRVTGGSGLGLAITKAIIEAHQGTVEVKSTLGSGTSFIISIPNLH